MNLQNSHILFAAQYAAPYKGNFIASLELLEKTFGERHNAQCAYLFPENAQNQPWISKFCSCHKVYFSGNQKQLISKAEAQSIIENFNPNLIYTHFEGYDLPMYNAARNSKRKIRLVWHMHDKLSYQKNKLKALYQVGSFFKHYGIPLLGKTANCVVGG